jgi:uncharacterized protein DUF4340
VVETPVTGARGPALLAVAGLAAVGFLLAMSLSGRTRPMQSLVKFEAAGVMDVTPDRIDRVELTAEGRQLTLTRHRSGRWTMAAPAEGTPVDASAQSHLEMSLKFMHVAAPVRVLSREEYRGTALGEYGLDPPRYTVSLYAGGRKVLATGFGAKNPQDVLQYVRVEGRDSLYLLPVFVGREWELLARVVTGS